MGKEIQKINDYNVNLQLLAEQYKNKEKFKKILEALNTQANNLETALFEIRDNFTIDNAVGIQLDIIGDILGINRNGRDDNSYRILIKLKADINFSAGTPEALIRSALVLFNATEVEYFPIYPAKVRLWVNNDINILLTFNLELDDGGLLELDDGGTLLGQEPDDTAKNFLLEVLPAGVGILYADNLILDDDNFLYLDAGDHMIVT